MPRIASALGASIEGAGAPLDAVAEYVADAPTLLVIDELEQIAGIAPELDELLGRCPGLRILATSRTMLRIRAEREYPVGPLSVPTFVDRPKVGDVASLPAVRLFVDRAQAARYGFTLTDENALAVTRSAGGSTACHSRSSWRRPGRACWTRRRCSIACGPASTPSGSGPQTSRNASAPCARRSNGASGFSRSTSWA